MVPLKKDPEPQIKAFSSSKKWSEWLSENYHKKEGIWLKLFKKGSGKKTISHDEALDEALCYGWIDGQGKSLDEISWIVRFTPRRANSVWSKRNRENVKRLLEENRVKTPGLEEIEKAKADGRWDAAYDSQKNMKIPEDFIKELKKDKHAYEFFKTLDKKNTYAIAYRLQTAKKPETRKNRMIKLLEMIKNKQKLY